MATKLNPIQYLLQLSNLSIAELAQIYHIPINDLVGWESDEVEIPTYIFPILMSALCNDGYIKEPPIITCDPRYMNPYYDEYSAPVINIKEWKAKHPKYIALVKLLGCNDHALLFIRNVEKGRHRLEQLKRDKYSDDPAVVII